MKRVVPLVLFLGASGLLFGIDLRDFNNVVDFDLNVQQIASLVSQSKQSEINPSKILILNGAVASIEIVQPQEKDFLALIELVSGDWVGTNQVNLYRVYLVVSGPEFFKRVPARVPREPPANIIQVNDQILVVGTYLNSGTAPDGKEVAVIQGLRIRNLP